MYSININDIHVSNNCFNDACLHTLSTVIFTWCNLCEIYAYIVFFCTKPRVVMRPALPLALWQLSLFHLLCNIVIQCAFVGSSLQWIPKRRPWLARKGEVRGVYCGFIIWSELWFSSFCVIFDITVYSTYSGYIRQRYSESLWYLLQCNNNSYISYMMLLAKFCIVISARCTGNLCEILS